MDPFSKLRYHSRGSTDVKFDTPAQKELGIEKAKHESSVGHGWLVPTPAITGRTGVGPR